jgi:hypothetical protein
MRRLKVNTTTSLAVHRFEPKPFDGKTFCISTVADSTDLNQIPNVETEHITASHLGLLDDRDTAHYAAARLIARIRRMN